MLRASLAIACLLSLLVASPVHAQFNTSMDVQVQIDQPAVAPGDDGQFTLQASQGCASSIQVLQPEEATVSFETPDGAKVTGPSSLPFGQQVCAQEPEQVVTARYKVHLPENATPMENQKFTVTVQAGDSSSPASLQNPAPPAEMRFVFYRAAPANNTTASALSAAPEKQAPAPAVPLLGLGLVAVAVFARRRA